MTDATPRGERATHNRALMIRRQVLLLSLGVLASLSVRAGLPEVIDAARPSVVAVGTYDALKSPRFTFRGTGFVVGQGDRVVTNAHVLPKAGDPDVESRLAVVVPRDGAAPDIRLVKRHLLDPTMTWRHSTSKARPCRPCRWPRGPLPGRVRLWC